MKPLLRSSPEVVPLRDLRRKVLSFWATGAAAVLIAAIIYAATLSAGSFSALQEWLVTKSAATATLGALDQGELGVRHRAVDVEGSSSVDASAGAGLLVRVKWLDNGQPAEGQQLRIVRPAGHVDLAERVGVTDDNGEWTATKLRPGKVTCATPQGTVEVVELREGMQAEVEIVLERGRTVRGEAVGGDGVPAPYAEIFVSPPFAVGSWHVATADGAGRFTIEGVAPFQMLWGRSSRWCSEFAQELGDELGGSKELELRVVMTQPARSVRGVVYTYDGAPAVGAVVAAGLSSPTQRMDPSTDVLRTVAPGSHVLTDKNGQFELAGQSDDILRLSVKYKGCAPWETALFDDRDPAPFMTIRLEREAVLRGVVRNECGEALSNAVVSWRRAGDVFHLAQRSDALGQFEMSGLPSGAVTLNASHRMHTPASISLNLVKAEAAQWNPVLSAGSTLRGRLVPRGAPADATFSVHVIAANGSWRSRAQLNDLEFEVPGVPAGGATLVVMRASGKQLFPIAQQDVDVPCARSIVVPFVYSSESAMIRCRLIDQHGAPLAFASASLLHPAFSVGRMTAGDAAGIVVFDALPPGEYEIGVEGEAGVGTPRRKVEVADGQTVDAGDIVCVVPCAFDVRWNSSQSPDVKAAWYVFGSQAQVLRSGDLRSEVIQRVLLPAGAQSFVVSGRDRTVQALDLRSGNCPQEFVDLRGARGSQVALSLARPAELDATSSLVLWNETGLPLRSWSAALGPEVQEELVLAPGRYRIGSAPLFGEPTHVLEFSVVGTDVGTTRVEYPSAN